jgi:hypothetical protein
MSETPCNYPRSNPLKESIQAALNGIVTNKSKASKFYLDTLDEHDHPHLYGEDHHQGLARTHRLSDGSVYFFLTHSKLTRDKKGELMQFRYGGTLDQNHIVETKPLTVAPLKQLLPLDERHPSDVVFLPDVNNGDSGYIFVTEEYDQRRVAVYQWRPDSQFNNLGTVFAGLPNKGPAYVFLDLVGDIYYLGIADTEGNCVVFQTQAKELFPTCTKGEINLGAFSRMGEYAFPKTNGACQVKLVQDSTLNWYLLGFRSDPDDDPHGTDYVDVYGIQFTPFVITPRRFSVHVDFPAGDTGFANTGTHYVEPSGRMLLSSSYRWSEEEGPGTSSYVSRVDEVPSA